VSEFIIGPRFARPVGIAGRTMRRRYRLRPSFEARPGGRSAG